MSKIEELLKNEKVEWKRLDEIFYIRTGYTPSKNIKEYWENGEIDWFTIEDIRNRGRILECANVKISKKGVKKDTFKKNSIILSIIATIGEHALIKTNFVVNQQFMVFTTKEEYDTKVNMNFMNYYFSKVSEYCKKNKRVGNVPTVDTQKILRLEIPIPSIETQEKIVKILDKFTELHAELHAELQARTKQYEYYRDMLLSEEYLNKLSNNPEILGGGGYSLKVTTLGEIAAIAGAGVDKKKVLGELPIKLLNYMDVYKNQYINSNIPTMNVTAPDNKIQNCNIEFGDIFVTPSSETTDDIFRSSVATEDIINTVYSYHIMRIRLKNKSFTTSCYLNYLFQNKNFRAKLYKRVFGNTRKTIAKSEIEQLEIVIPSIGTQEKTVKILDRFTNYVTELQVELQARTKQYEYYREKLLSFEK